MTQARQTCVFRLICYVSTMFSYLFVGVHFWSSVLVVHLSRIFLDGGGQMQGVPYSLLGASWRPWTLIPKVIVPTRIWAKYYYWVISIEYSKFGFFIICELELVEKPKIRLLECSNQIGLLECSIHFKTITSAYSSAAYPGAANIRYSNIRRKIRIPMCGPQTLSASLCCGAFVRHLILFCHYTSREV